MKTTSTVGGLLAALLTASLTAGSAIKTTQPPQSSFAVQRTGNKGFNGRNGPLALARAYKKYGVTVSETLLQAIETTHAAMNRKRDSGSVTATPDKDDLEYLVPVQIGTPAQTLYLDLDTGSSDLWVFSPETDARTTVKHNRYDPGKSSTSKKLDGSTWQITYADESSCSGDVYMDTVTINGLTVKQQAVESALTVSEQLAEGNGDGLLGLAFSSINTVRPTPQETWFDRVSGSLDSPLFVADLRHDAPGSYVFGAVPPAVYDVQYAPVDSSQGFWQFSTSNNLGASFNAIADTGTTLLLVDDGIVGSYYAEVPGAVGDEQQGGYVFGCDAKLPDFSFAVGGGNITVPGALINYAPTGDGRCFGGIQSAGDIPMAIFGDVALKAAYVVFDAGEMRLGWAQKVYMQGPAA